MSSVPSSPLNACYFTLRVAILYHYHLLALIPEYVTYSVSIFVWAYPTVINIRVRDALNLLAFLSYALKVLSGKNVNRYACLEKKSEGVRRKNRLAIITSILLSLYYLDQKGMSVFVARSYLDRAKIARVKIAVWSEYSDCAADYTIWEHSAVRRNITVAYLQIYASSLYGHAVANIRWRLG